MPPKASGTSLRGGRSTRKGFKLALPEPTIKKSSPSKSGSPTQTGSSIQKQKTEGSSTQIVSIKTKSFTQEPPKKPNIKTNKGWLCLSDTNTFSLTRYRPYQTLKENLGKYCLRIWWWSWNWFTNFDSKNQRIQNNFKSPQRKTDPIPKNNTEPKTN